MCIPRMSQDVRKRTPFTFAGLFDFDLSKFYRISQIDTAEVF